MGFNVFLHIGFCLGFSRKMWLGHKFYLVEMIKKIWFSKFVTTSNNSLPFSFISFLLEVTVKTAF